MIVISMEEVIKTANQPGIDKRRKKKEKVIGLMSAHYPVDVRSAVVKITKKAIIVLNVERI